MCGILFTNDPAISQMRFSKALNIMGHRGPDAANTIYVNCAHLGHTRLKILDLDDRSNQPFYSRDGRYIIVYNGEIYNFRELAREHAIKQRTTSDTEVLVELYAKHGARCLPMLNGMYAFVIYDTHTSAVFAARDRLGVKPLYMSLKNEVCTFASEISPILEITGIQKYDEIGLRQYRKLRTFFNGRTAYSGVEMFPAGCYFENGRVHRYWEFPEVEQDPPEDDELRSMIIESVRQRLISDVSIGSYLSGGLDSTIIARLADRPHTWTVGFSQRNEFEWGRLASEYIKSNHHEVLIDPEEFVEIARRMIRKRREPLSVPNEVLLYKMTAEVKKHNTVVMSGEGADELFFGYDRIFRWAARAKKFDIVEFDRLYAYGTHEDLDIVEDAIRPFMHRRKPIDVVSQFFQIAHLHGLLRRLDNATMMCSVEARVPFVDCHTLIERMAGVPFEYRLCQGVIKAPLKRIFSDYIPARIIAREKIGFPVPLEIMPWGSAANGSPMDQWLEFNMRELMGSV